MENKEPRAVYTVRTWVPEDQLEEWSEWHTEVHVADVAAQPGVRSARKYRVTEDNHPGEWTPQYITIYEFDSLGAFEAYRDSPAGARLRKEYADHYGATGKISRQVVVLAADINNA